MNCAACGHSNPDRAKFCLECGTPIAARCASCGTELPPAAKFCLECGARTAAAPAPASPPASPRDAGARKVVTILFADLAGSTALQERLDAESTSLFMQRYYAAMRAAVEAHGGTVVKLLGDGVMVAFGVPRVAEDDALRAVRAGVAMQQAFRVLAGDALAADTGIGLRVAVNTGEVVVNADHSDVVGDPVNVAARLQQEAGDGEVVLGEATQPLVASLVTIEPIGSVALKGRSEAVQAYRVVSLERPQGAATTAFVGRDEELGRLTAVYDRAVATPASVLVVLLGSPGLGKSRLIDEFARRQGAAATVVTAQCDAAGGATFAPLVQALRALLAIEDGADADAVRTAIELAVPGDDEQRRIAGGIAALLTGSPASPEETFFAVRRFLAGVAHARPVLLVIDDLHWAEPLLLDLVEHLVHWGAGVPLMVLVGARPELHTVRSTLVTPGGLVADVVTLTGLDAGAAMRLAANVIGAADLPAAAAAKVLATSEGNPLFVGELVRMLVQEGALTKEGERWTIGAGLAALEMPPTIHALLAARIERLRPDERSVLERAAVVGRHFSRSAVAALLPRDAVDLDAALESLRRGELIERDAGWFLGEPVLRFHHVLIRDAAYRRLLKGTRAELHGRLADWIEAQVGDAADHDESIGRHLEQAHQHLRELGPLDAQGRRLGERASQRLAAAGRRALAGDDLPLAAGLLGRAIAGLDEADPARADLALDWCEALLAAGDVGPAAQAIDELGRHVEAAAPSAPVAGGNGAPIQQAPTERRPPGDARRQRLAAWRTCFTGQLTVLTAPEALQATADAVAAAAAEFAALGDAAGEAKAHQVHAQALARLGRVGACEAALDRALAAARKAGDRRRANAVLAGAPLAALWGPSPVTRASGRCLDVVRVLRITQGAPAVEAVALSCQGVLEALRGRTDAARRMIASSRKMVEELGITHRLFEADAFVGRIELLEGDAVAAERSLRGAYAGLRDLGLGIDAAQAAALLGRALLAQQRGDEAEALSRESEALAGDDLQAAIAWRGVRAEALAQRGEHAAAVDLAQAAVTIAAATDALLDHADARLALAVALRAAGRAGEAEAEKRRAIELWEAKGATLLAERVRADKALVEPSAKPRLEPTRPTQRRVAANAATVAAAEFDATFASRNIAALESAFVHSAGVRVVDHPTESTYGREEALESFRRLLRCKDPVVRHQPLATLGESLGLFRRHIASGGSTGRSFDVAAFEREELVVTEPGVLIEIFAGNRLGAAVARLYERYAERLAGGRERERAVGTAAAVAAALVGPPDLDALCRAMAPDVELIDHRVLGFAPVRGVAAMREYLRALFEAGRFSLHLDDVLGVRPGAILFRETTAGTVRSGGGHHERPLLSLWRFGDDGRLARIEEFDISREAEAVASFDELAGRPAPPVRRRVRPNAAAQNATASTAALGAADLEGAARLVAESMQVIHHPTGRAYGRAELVESWRQLLKAKGIAVREEILATLGDSLALSRQLIAFDSIGDERAGSFGAVDSENLILREVDGTGRTNRSEIFAVDHLGDAVVRLYARYAELLPEGSDRQRAAVTARAVAYSVTDSTTPDVTLLFDPRYEDIDHRNVGYGTLSIEEARKLVASQRALADELRFRVEDILALRPDGLVRKTTTSGVWRDGGGAFERTVCLLSMFGADGRAARQETFDGDREAETLARFDELTAASAQPNVARRVRPNAAAAAMTRFEAAFAARDLEAVKATFAPTLKVIDHPNGASYAHAEEVASVRRLLRSPETVWRHTTLACLGDSLSLDRRAVTGRGTAGSRYDVGDYAVDHVTLSEVDGRGRFEHIEAFATEHLGDAIVRLYERHAERLPEGPARARASALAEFVAVVNLSTADLDRLAAVVAPDFEGVDHRHLSTWSVRGAAAYLAHLRALRQVADDVAFAQRDILALNPTALLTRVMHSGTERREGGGYERHFLSLFATDAEGRLVRAEWFDDDGVDEALARFDALTTGAPPARPERRLRPNAATAVLGRMEVAFAARNLDAVDTLLGEAMESVDHQTGTAYGREGHLDSSRRMMRLPDLVFRLEVLATLGERLCLMRRLVSASGTAGGHFDVAEYEMEHVGVLELDATGRCRSFETFAADHFDAAVVRFYERYAESLPAGPARERAAATARSLAAFDDGPDGWAATMAPDIVQVDHRTLSTWSARGRAAVLAHLRSLQAVAGGITVHSDDVLAASPDVLLRRCMHTGTDLRGGGRYESVHLCLTAMASDGRVARVEFFDADRAAEALARFDELAAGRPAVLRCVRPNAASALAARFQAAFAAGDDAALGDLFASGLDVVDHPNGATYGRDGHLGSLRGLRRARDPVLHFEPIATLGEALFLSRRHIRASGMDSERFDVGAYEREEIVLFEVGEGRCRHIEVFAADRLGDAIARLYERYAELLPDGPERSTAATTARAVAVMKLPIDLARMATVLAGSVGCVDHRILGTWSLQGAEEALGHYRLRAALTTEFFSRDDDVLALEPHAALVRRTYCGTLRDTGGSFENPLILLMMFGADGLHTWAEVWEPDREAEALARFDELVGRRPPARANRLVTNAATPFRERINAAWRARDWVGLAELLASDYRFSDRRRMVQVELDRKGWVEMTRRLGAMSSARVETEELATRGNRLALWRVRIDVADEDVGPSCVEHLNLHEVNAAGDRLIGGARFDADDLDTAYAELDARYEAGEGAAHPAHAVVMHAFAAAVASRDWDPVIALCAPTFVEHDHRALAVLGTTRGAAAWAENFRTLTDLAPDTIYRVDHFRSAARGFCSVGTWHGTRDGGRYEIALVAVIEVDARDRMARADIYDLEHAGQALARFAELKAATAAPPRFANAATATVNPVITCMGAHDWQGFARLFADEFHMSDRRRVVQLELDRDQYVAFTREVADGRAVRGVSELLATRGERLALARSTFEFADADVGPSEIAFLILTEVDGRGRIVAYVRWDVDDLETAYAELAARWAASDAATHPRGAQFVAGYERCFAARDWSAMTALCAPDLVAQSHRLVGWGTLQGPAGLVSTMQAQIELAPDTRVRMDHVRTCAGGAIFQYAWHGTRDGGAFENLYIIVVEVDSVGRARRVDGWEAEQLEQAQARFAEIAASAASDESSSEPFANAATRAVDRGTAALAARDWEGFAALMAAGFRHYDRTRVAQIETDGRQWLASFRQMVEMTSSRPTQQLLATRGERLALLRVLWRGAEGDIGPSEIDWLLIVEVDGRGDHLAVVAFDPDDLAAAYTEIDARWAAGEATAYPRAAHWQRDFAATRDRPDAGTMAALFSPLFVARDHRLVGWGTLHGPVAFLETLRTLAELAPDVQFQLDHLRACDHGILSAGAWAGTRDGGAFESPLASVVEVDAHGKALRLDLYDPHHLDQAFARFAEIGAAEAQPGQAAGGDAATRSPIAAPTLATASMERLWAALDAQDTDAARALFTADFTWDDRRPLVGLSGDLDLMITSVRERLAIGAQVARHSIVGSAGERICISRVLWAGGPTGGRFEIEFLAVHVFDAAGLGTAWIFFDPDDARGAQREAWARWAAIDPRVAAMTTAVGEFIDCWNAGDPERLRAAFAEDLVVEDHRRTGTGRSEGREAYVQSVVALWELAPESRFDAGWHWLAIAPEAGAYPARRSGTLPDGGEFESDFLVVSTVKGGRFTRVEIFEIDAADAALARVAALRFDPLRIPPNAASRASDRHWALAWAGKWDAVQTLHAPSLVFDDRRQGLRTTTDGAAYLAGLRWGVGDPRVQATRTLLATAGDRLELRLNRFTRTEGEVLLFEIETLAVTEIDAESRLVAIVLFDPADRAAASTELFERYAASSAGGIAQRAIEVARAWNDHDLERLRALLPDDFYLDDRRRTGVGRVEGVDAYIDSLAAMHELSRDLRLDVLYYVTVAAHGRVYVARWSGTNLEGGEFDAVYVCLGLARGDRLVGLEIFELEDFDAALARFETLRPDIATTSA